MRCKACGMHLEDSDICSMCKQSIEEFDHDMYIEEAGAFSFFNTPEDFEEQDSVFTFSDDPTVDDIPF